MVDGPSGLGRPSVLPLPLSRGDGRILSALGERPGRGTYESRMRPRIGLDVRMKGPSVLSAADTELAIRQLGGRVHDLREPDDGDHVVHGDVTPVDLLEEVDHLLVAAELGVVV